MAVSVSRSAMPRNPASSPTGSSKGAMPGPEALAELGQGPVEAGTLAVQLVDEHEAGEPELGGQLPGGLGLGLDALDGAHHEDHEVGHRAGGPDLAEEVGVARGVDDVELHVAHGARGQGQGDRQVALDLLGLEVAHGRAVLDLPLALGGAVGEEEGLGQRGLARAVVPDQGHVADPGRRVARHPCTSLSRRCGDPPSPCGAAYRRAPMPSAGRRFVPPRRPGRDHVRWGPPGARW